MAIDCLPQLHVAAIHEVAGYRNDTPGIGIICRNATILAGAGFYRNSIAHRSNYAIIGYQPFTPMGIRLGVFAGIVNGYPYRSGNYFVAGGVIASLPLTFGELYVVTTPHTSINPAVIEFSIALKF